MRFAGTQDASGCSRKLHLFATVSNDKISEQRTDFSASSLEGSALIAHLPNGLNGRLPNISDRSAELF
jgi:hypothetical protein